MPIDSGPAPPPPVLPVGGWGLAALSCLCCVKVSVRAKATRSRWSRPAGASLEGEFIAAPRIKENQR